jgi:hypothetical protein
MILQEGKVFLQRETSSLAPCRFSTCGFARNYTYHHSFGSLHDVTLLHGDGEVLLSTAVLAYVKAGM